MNTSDLKARLNALIHEDEASDSDTLYFKKSDRFQPSGLFSGVINYVEEVIDVLCNLDNKSSSIVAANKEVLFNDTLDNIQKFESVPRGILRTILDEKVHRNTLAQSFTATSIAFGFVQTYEGDNSPSLDVFKARDIRLLKERALVCIEVMNKLRFSNPSSYESFTYDFKLADLQTIVKYCAEVGDYELE